MSNQGSPTLLDLGCSTSFEPSSPCWRLESIFGQVSRYDPTRVWEPVTGTHQNDAEEMVWRGRRGTEDELGVPRVKVGASHDTGKAGH
jgi:hypothetical protein